MGQRPGDRKSDEKPRRRSAEGVDPGLEEEDAEEPVTGRPERQVKGGQPPITARCATRTAASRST